MSATLLPFLQFTYTREQLLPVIEKHEEAKKAHQDHLWRTSKVKTKLGVITLIGGAETLCYVIAAVTALFLGIFSKNMKAKKVRYFCLLKGGLSATYITFYSLGGTSRAKRLIIRIEMTADKQFKNLSLKSEARFEKTLDKARKDRISQFLKKNKNPAELKPSIWDQQAIDARQKLKELVQSLNEKYPTLQSDHKYCLLVDAKRSIRVIVQSINQFTI